jgi:hypothetical protein
MLGLMARDIELTDDALVIRYEGLSSAVTVMREVRIPYATIDDVTVGLNDLPGAFAWRLGMSTAPFGTTRRGRFRHEGRSEFLDLQDPEHAVVLDLTRAPFDRVAFDAPEGFSEELRERLDTGARFQR